MSEFDTYAQEIRALILIMGLLLLTSSVSHFASRYCDSFQMYLESSLIQVEQCLNRKTVVPAKTAASGKNGGSFQENNWFSEPSIQRIISNALWR